MKIITVHFTVRPERRAEALDLCRAMIAPSRAEAGCIRYELYQDVTDAHRFFFYEEWADQQAVDEHTKAPHYIDFVPRFGPLLTAPADLQVRSVQ